MDKSKEIIAQAENIECIFVTLDVSKFDKFKDFNCKHLSNINSIFVTLDVLKLDKSKDIKFEQPQNI